MRILWRSLAVVGGLVLLLIIAVAIAIRTVDVNDFVGPIQARVKENTGRELAIRGGIELKLSMEPKLVLNDVSLANAPWGRAPQMLSAKRIEGQVALLPLLRRRFEVQQFHLVEPTIALETDPAGKGNWEFGTTPAAAASGAVPTESGAARLEAFGIGDLAVSNGALTYRDGKSGKLTQVVIESLSLHARDAQSPVSAQFRGKVDDVSVALDGDFGPLDTLLQRRWPYPLSMKGEINGQKATLVTKMRVADGGVGLEDIQLGMGSGKLTGQLNVTTSGPRPKLSFKLAAPTLSLADLSLASAAAAAAAKTADARAAKSRYVFKEDAIGVSALKAVDAKGELTIDKLVFPDGQHVDRLHTQFTLQNGRLDAPLTANIFGGTLQTQLRMDATRDNDAAVSLRLDAKDMDLATALAALGVVREVRGGKTRLTLDVSTHGNSPRQWASSATGSATVLVGQATLVHTKADRTTPLAQLTSAINPFHDVDSSSELQCAVIRMPLKNGVAQIDRSIAFETKKLAASASGTLDFHSETLDLSIRPQIREGIPINVSQIAQLVRLRGPFTSPSVGIDAMGSAATVARIGAAVSTGGWSLLGEALLSSTTDNPAAPCQVALGRASTSQAAAAKQEAPRKPGAPGLDEVGKALGRLLGR